MYQLLIAKFGTNIADKIYRNVINDDFMELIHEYLLSKCPEKEEPLSVEDYILEYHDEDEDYGYSIGDINITDLLPGAMLISERFRGCNCETSQLQICKYNTYYIIFEYTTNVCKDDTELYFPELDYYFDNFLNFYKQFVKLIHYTEFNYHKFLSGRRKHFQNDINFMARLYNNMYKGNGKALFLEYMSSKYEKIVAHHKN